MLAVAGYRVEKRLHATRKSVVVVALRETDEQEVVLKAYADDAAGGESQARREYELLHSVDGCGAVRALGLVESAGNPVLVLERIPGLTLSEYVREGPLAPHAFLAIASQLAATLARLHEARILHRDLHPGNVLVDPGTLHTRLIDFGSARQLLHGSRRSHHTRSVTGGLVGALHFMAPEQTGRMDRGIDYRSDLYGLGATLYYALTGTTPFEGTDPLALIHAHMARMPEPPVARRPGTPAALSRIVLKLMEKQPEDRYQTAQALHRDLCECQAQWQQGQRIDDALPLGIADAPLRPAFAVKLYGREPERQALQRAFEQAALGRTQWVLIRGAPGSGKSALVRELRGPVASAGGYLVNGKFELYRRDVPYAGWIAALHSLVNQILVESDEGLRLWRTELRTALGAIAGALVELIPELGIVLGEVPPLPPLGPKETQARLAFALQRLLQGCARPERPLVLFLDDVQWADPGSWRLLESLPAAQDTPLLVICCYRDTELDTANALAPVLETVNRTLPCTQIELRELAPEANQQMLADALGRTADEVRSLAEIVVRKTGNNPLLLQQFVLHMHALGRIRFEHPRGWTWDDAAIAAAEVPEGAVGLLVSKLGKLEPGARELIEFASCVGHEFELARLVQLSGRAESSFERPLLALLEEGLIVPSPAGFRFAHDRIQEAAQSLVDATRRVELHREMARLLQASALPEELPERAFEIADHWNHALAVLAETERQQALAANAAAATRALRAGSAANATSYFEAALQLLRDADWERARALVFDVFLGAAEAAYQLRALDTALRHLEALASHNLDRNERTRVDIQRISVLAAMQRPEVIDAVLAALRPLGANFPKRPSIARTLVAMLWTARQIGAADERVFRRVSSRPPDVELWDRVLAAGGVSLIRHSVLLILLALSRSLRLGVRHGTVDSIGLALAGFANGWHEAGFSRKRWLQYVRAVQRWIETTPSPSHIRAQFTLDCYALCYTGPRRALAESQQRLHSAFREIGDIEFANFTLILRSHFLLLCGERLDSTLAGAPGAPAQLEPGAPKELPISAGLRESIRALGRGYELLRGGAHTPPDWSAALASTERSIQGQPPLRRVAVQIHWAFALCAATEYGLAAEHMERFAPDVNQATGVGGSFLDFALLRGLCAAALIPDSPRPQARAHRRTLARSLRKLRAFSGSGPDFLHLRTFLEAEHAALRGAVPRALHAYARAAQRARQCGYRHHAALIAERHASLLRAQRRVRESLIPLAEATALYREWGAEWKARALEAIAAEQRPTRP